MSFTGAAVHARQPLQPLPHREAGQVFGHHRSLASGQVGAHHLAQQGVDRHILTGQQHGGGLHVLGHVTAAAGHGELVALLEHGHRLVDHVLATGGQFFPAHRVRGMGD